MKQTLTTKSFIAVLWSAGGTFFAQGISFVIGLVLARLLMPSEYGLVSIAVIFNGISAVFVNSGFSSAIIRKKTPTHADLSTVFNFNILAASIIYVLIFIFSPHIANYFNHPQLIVIIRILSLNIVISALGSIQVTLYMKKLDYKTQSLSKIISSLISGIIGIFLAYNKFGVWALIVQSILQQIISLFILWAKSNWKPSLIFSKSSFKELFNFGSKLLVSNLLFQIFSQIYPVLIGKFFPLAQLGYYNRADNYQKMIGKTLSNMVVNVAFPSLSAIQNDTSRLREGYRRIIKMTMFINVPIMFCLIVISKPLIIVLITDKWLPVVPYLKWLCVSGVFYPLLGITMNIFKVKGRSDLYLLLVIVKKSIILISIIIAFRWGVIGLVISQAITAFLAYLIYGFYSGRYINYKLINQIKDISPFFILSGFMALFAILIGDYFNNLLIKMIFQLVFCGVFYYSISRLFKLSSLLEIQKLLLNLYRKEK